MEEGEALAGDRAGKDGAIDTHEPHVAQLAHLPL